MPGTVKGIDDFDPSVEAERIRDAIAGWGTDEDKVLQTISTLNNAQRQEVAETFKQMYGKDLNDDLKSELTGDFEEAVLSAMTAPRVYDARQLHGAMDGLGTSEMRIVEILVTRSNEEIAQIKEIYKEEFESELEDDLCGETSGYFRRMFVSLCTGARDEDGDDDPDKATEDAQRLHDAGEGCWGTEEAEINAVLCLRSPSQLRLIIDEYERLHETTIEDAIRGECAGDLQDGYIAIIEAARNKPAYFARRAKDAMAGFGTSDTDLIRIIVSRSEVDLEEVKEEYQRLYECSLSDAVESECSSDYKRMLLNLINPPC